MDLLSQRYANPCFFMDGMIKTGRFSEFVFDLVKTINEEKEDKSAWEFYLHRVFEGSFEEFKQEIKTNKANSNLSKRTIETTVQHSMNILNNFNPETRG